MSTEYKLLRKGSSLEGITIDNKRSKIDCLGLGCNVASLLKPEAWAWSPEAWRASEGYDLCYLLPESISLEWVYKQEQDLGCGTLAELAASDSTAKLGDAAWARNGLRKKNENNITNGGAVISGLAFEYALGTDYNFHPYQASLLPGLNWVMS